MLRKREREKERKREREKERKREREKERKRVHKSLASQDCSAKRVP